MTTAKQPTTDPNAAEFIEELARALHIYGLPSHRLEEALRGMSQELAVDAQFLVTPTAIVSSVGTTTHLARIDQGQTHLERLADVNRIMSNVRKGHVTPAEGTQQIRRFDTQPARYGVVATILAFALASASAAVFFGGGWRESVSAGSIGATIGCISMLAGSRPRLVRLLPTFSGFLAALGAHVLATQLQPMFGFLATLAGLIILIPGLSLTIAMSELAHNHLVSGTARLVGSTITFLQLGFGAAIGWKLAPMFWREITMVDPAPLPQWWQWITLLVATASFVVLFRAHPRDYLSILLGATVAYAASRWGSETLGPEIGMAIGAWALGCASTLFARATHRPAAIPLLPGLLLLVPGSLGLRSLQALVGNDVSLGVQSAFTMTLFAVSLVTGLFLANLTLRPRQL
ncbi:MAG: threonine/serine exporter family protein [Planctomycetota bacterium]